jgi:pre-mRNA-processing factor SLU7
MSSASAVAAARLTKDEYKKAKELEEARKAGTAPPEIDEDGNAVNPHIPSYIANAPCMFDYHDISSQLLLLTMRRVFE